MIGRNEASTGVSGSEVRFFYSNMYATCLAKQITWHTRPNMILLAVGGLPDREVHWKWGVGGEKLGRDITHIARADTKNNWRGLDISTYPKLPKAYPGPTALWCQMCAQPQKILESY